MEKDLSWEEELISVGNEVYVMRYAKVPGYIGNYKYRVKLDNGQTVQLEVFITSDANSLETYQIGNTAVWSVFLYVTSKKKRGYEFLKQTGRNGLTPLFLAKEMLKYHIDNVIKSRSQRSKDHIIWIVGDDKRRDKVYERGLRDLGFVVQDGCSFNKSNYGKGLVKIIKKT